MLDRIAEVLLAMVFEGTKAGVFSAITNAFFLLLAGLLFIPLEGLFRVERLRPAPQRVERWADVVHAMVNPVLASITAATLSLLLHPDIAKALAKPALGRTRAEHVEGWLNWLRTFGEWLWRDAHLPFAMFLAALCGYWLHRALHSWGFLWRLHAVHHSSERVDWLSAHRQHPLEVILIVAVTVAPGIMLGLSPQTIVAVIVFQKLHLFFSHAATRLPFGPLRFVIVTPRHHHWHHAKDARCNYAGLFPVLDMIFGTYRYEPWFPEETGSSSHVHTGWIAHLFHPLRRRVHVDSEVCWCRERLEHPLYGREAEKRAQRAVEDAGVGPPGGAVGTRAEADALRHAISHVVATG